MIHKHTHTKKKKKKKKRTKGDQRVKLSKGPGNAFTNVVNFDDRPLRIN